jgi:hypothetical protein
MFVAVHLIEANIAFLNNLAQAAVGSACGAIVYLATMMVLSRNTVLSAFRVVRGLIS